MVWLAGRDADRRLLRRRWEAACRGAAQAIVVCGGAGLGKSSLLVELHDRLRGQSVMVRGFVGEHPPAFTVVTDVLRALARRGVTPGEGALASLLGTSSVDGTDPHRVGAELLMALDAASADGPLALLVDDLHAVDASSRIALGFAMRRLADESVLLLASCRPTSVMRPLLDDLPVLTLEPLPAPTARAVLRRAAGTPLPPAVERVLLGVAAGNPLALCRLPMLLDGDQLAGRAPLPDRLPVDDALTGLYRPTIGLLPGPAREALQLAALTTDGRAAPVVELLAADAPGAFDALEDADLLRVHGSRLVLAHPLVAPAALDDLPAAARRRLLRDLAAARTTAPATAVSYRAAATRGADPDLAAEMAAVGRLQRRQGAAVEAGTALARAAELHPDAAVRVQLRVEAARAMIAGGEVATARTLLTAVLAEHPGPEVADEATLLLAIHESMSGDPLGAHARLETAATEAEASGRAGAELLRAALALPLGMLGLPREIVAATDAALVRVPPHDVTWCHVAATAAHGRAALRTGDAADLLGRVLAEVDPDRAVLADDPTLPLHVGRGLAMIERLDDAVIVLGHLIRSARRIGPTASLTLALGTLGEVHLRRCAWPDAEVAVTEALELGEVIGHPAFATFWFAVRARLRAATGDVTGCREDLRIGLERAEALSLVGATFFLETSRGLLALGQGLVEEAVEALTTCQAFEDLGGPLAPTLGRWRPELVEAHLLAGDLAGATQAAGHLRTAADEPGCDRWTVGVRHRCDALLRPVDDPRGLASATRAVEVLDPIIDRFDHARAQVVLADRLAAAGQEDESAVVLSDAAAAFAALGAAPWRATVDARLTTLGRALPTTDPPSLRRLLTPVELQIVQLVAEGMTNHQIARSIFLSPKTVANHLTRAYRKLGVSSRVEAARAVIADPA